MSYRQPKCAPGDEKRADQTKSLQINYSDANLLLHRHLLPTHTNNVFIISGTTPYRSILNVDIAITKEYGSTKEIQKDQTYNPPPTSNTSRRRRKDEKRGGTKRGAPKTPEPWRFKMVTRHGGHPFTSTTLGLYSHLQHLNQPNWTQRTQLIWRIRLSLHRIWFLQK